MVNDSSKVQPAQAIVPLKDLVEAKTRLSGLLRPAERRALAQAMAEDVLSVLAVHPAIAGVTLVSDDPGAAMLADKFGANHWSERALGGTGLNDVIAKATARLLETWGGAILVLHADIPLLRSNELDVIVNTQRDNQGLVVGCDKAETGTNLLAFDAECVPQFHFGSASCAAHERWAHEAEVPVVRVREQGIALDIDEPQDLAMLIAELENISVGVEAGVKVGAKSSGVERETAKLLAHSTLGIRLNAALDARDGLAQAAANAEFNPGASGKQIVEAGRHEQGQLTVQTSKHKADL